VDTYWSASGYADVSAVPEPGTWALGIFGLILFAGWRSVRSKKEWLS
jgi:hypothetical protein